jgi:ComF family protein
MLAAAANAAVRLLLAPDCAACGARLDRPLEGTVCARCWRAVRRIPPPCCAICGDAFPGWRVPSTECARCRRQPPSFAAARSGGQYDGALREIVHAFKYQHRRPLAAPLATLMRDAGAELLDQADAVVPVPLHPWRAFQRGFNQADDLARHLGLPVLRLLRRRRHGPPQAHLPASRRHANVRHAYACRRLPSIAWMSTPHGLARDRVLVLIDDVMTTGATLDACGRVLMEAGARTVFALTAARAVAGRPAPLPPSPDLSADRRRW